MLKLQYLGDWHKAELFIITRWPPVAKLKNATNNLPMGGEGVESGASTPAADNQPR